MKITNKTKILHIFTLKSKSVCHFDIRKCCVILQSYLKIIKKTKLDNNITNLYHLKFTVKFIMF